MFQFSGSMATLASLSGICAHVFLYRHGEWDVTAPFIVVSCIVVSLALLAVERSSALRFRDVVPAPGWASNCVIYHVLGVYGSMLLYRAVLHRLNRFPGPFWARLSNLYVTSLSARKFQLYEEVEKLHAKYGDYVRIGPTELSILDPTAVKMIYSSQAKTSKGPWYNCLEPRVSLQTSRDKADHGRRRRVWDQGFSSNALRDYEPRVSHYAGQLVRAIEKSLGLPIDMTQWSNYYGFDVMGDLAFGRPFEMLEKGEDTYFLTQLHADMKSIGLFSHLMWLFPFFKRIPVLNADYLKFWRWIDEQVKQRIQNTPGRPDVFSWLLGAFENGPKAHQDYLNLQGDAYLICVAGSDTTSATLTNVLFHLAKYPDLTRELQLQVTGLPNLSNDRLASLSLLDALINETLRLHPVVPSGIQRITPPEGIMIGDRHIPGDVMVCMPMHTLFRDDRVFARPREFIPERWTTRPELIKDPSAWMPFGGGPYVCVGKQLAMMEVRRVVAEILVRYDIAFAPTQSEHAFLDGKRDAFTLVAAPLQLVFQKREFLGSS